MDPMLYDLYQTISRNSDEREQHCKVGLLAAMTTAVRDGLLSDPSGGKEQMDQWARTAAESHHRTIAGRSTAVYSRRAAMVFALGSFFEPLRRQCYL